MVSLPLELCAFDLAEREIVPRYLTERDHPWLGSLLDEYARFEGKPRREIDRHLREQAHGPPADELRARHVLDRACKTRIDAAVPPRKARAAVFASAAVSPTRELAMARAGEALAIDPGTLEGCLFADLGPERVLGPLPAWLGPEALALRVNLATVQGLLRRASHAELWARGAARDIVRAAQLFGTGS